ncbi:DUF7230 family protein [Methylomonas sp. MgM2]
MRKRNKAKGLREIPIKNPVAKFAHHYNKSQVFSDKRKYQRKAKHPAREPFSTAFGKALEQGFDAGNAVHAGF